MLRLLGISSWNATNITQICAQMVRKQTKPNLKLDFALYDFTMAHGFIWANRAHDGSTKICRKLNKDPEWWFVSDLVIVNRERQNTFWLLRRAHFGYTIEKKKRWWIVMDENLGKSFPFKNETLIIMKRSTTLKPQNESGGFPFWYFLKVQFAECPGLIKVTMTFWLDKIIVNFFYGIL